eukprot:scaffold33883_cov63-Phaeocystis_antarctica.AAC.1
MAWKGLPLSAASEQSPSSARCNVSSRRVSTTYCSSTASRATSAGYVWMCLCRASSFGTLMMRSRSGGGCSATGTLTSVVIDQTCPMCSATRAHEPAAESASTKCRARTLRPTAPSMCAACSSALSGLWSARSCCAASCSASSRDAT